MLNAVNTARSKGGGYNVKVVSMDKGMKESKGLASMMSGDNTQLADEIVLQCKQRGLGYTVFKMGEIVQNENAASVQLSKDRYPISHSPILVSTAHCTVSPILLREPISYLTLARLLFPSYILHTTLQPTTRLSSNGRQRC